MPKSRTSFLKRQREIAKKERREAKLQRKRDRKAAAEAEPAPEETLEVLEGPQIHEAPEAALPADLEVAPAATDDERP